MNNNVVEKTLKSIDNIDRLSDLAAISIYNTSHEAIDKFDVMQEHATPEYVEGEFVQESLLTGVLIGAGIIGVAISAFLIIKKIIESKAKGDPNAAPNTPEGADLTKPEDIQKTFDKWKTEYFNKYPDLVVENVKGADAKQMSEYATLLTDSVNQFTDQVNKVVDEYMENGSEEELIEGINFIANLIGGTDISTMLSSEGRIDQSTIGNLEVSAVAIAKSFKEFEAIVKTNIANFEKKAKERNDKGTEEEGPNSRVSEKTIKQFSDILKKKAEETGKIMVAFRQDVLGGFQTAIEAAAKEKAGQTKQQSDDTGLADEQKQKIINALKAKGYDEHQISDEVDLFGKANTIEEINKSLQDQYDELIKNPGKGVRDAFERMIQVATLVAASKGLGGKGAISIRGYDLNALETPSTTDETSDKTENSDKHEGTPENTETSSDNPENKSEFDDTQVTPEKIEAVVSAVEARHPDLVVTEHDRKYIDWFLSANDKDTGISSIIKILERVYKNDTLLNSNEAGKIPTFKKYLYMAEESAKVNGLDTQEIEAAFPQERIDRLGMKSEDITSEGEKSEEEIKTLTDEEKAELISAMQSYAPGFNEFSFNRIYNNLKEGTPETITKDIAMQAFEQLFDSINTINLQESGRIVNEILMKKYSLYKFIAKKVNIDFSKFNIEQPSLSRPEFNQLVPIFDDVKAGNKNSYQGINEATKIVLAKYGFNDSEDNSEAEPSENAEKKDETSSENDVDIKYDDNIVAVTMNHSTRERRKDWPDDYNETANKIIKAFKMHNANWEPVAYINNLWRNGTGDGSIIGLLNYEYESTSSSEAKQIMYEKSKIAAEAIGEPVDKLPPPPSNEQSPETSERTDKVDITPEMEEKMKEKLLSAGEISQDGNVDENTVNHEIRQIKDMGLFKWTSGQYGDPNNVMPEQRDRCVKINTARYNAAYDLAEVMGITPSLVPKPKELNGNTQESVKSEDQTEETAAKTNETSNAKLFTDEEDEKIVNAAYSVKGLTSKFRREIYNAVTDDGFAEAAKKLYAKYADDANKLKQINTALNDMAKSIGKESELSDLPTTEATPTESATSTENQTPEQTETPVEKSSEDSNDIKKISDSTGIDEGKVENIYNLLKNNTTPDAIKRALIIDTISPMMHMSGFNENMANAGFATNYDNFKKVAEAANIPFEIEQPEISEKDINNMHTIIDGAGDDETKIAKIADDLMNSIPAEKKDEEQEGEILNTADTIDSEEPDKQAKYVAAIDNVFKNFKADSREKIKNAIIKHNYDLNKYLNLYYNAIDSDDKIIGPTKDQRKISRYNLISKVANEVGYTDPLPEPPASPSNSSGGSEQGLFGKLFNKFF